MAAFALGQLLPEEQRPFPMDMIHINDTRTDIVPNAGQTCMPCSSNGHPCMDTQAVCFRMCIHKYGLNIILVYQEYTPTLVDVHCDVPCFQICHIPLCQMQKPVQLVSWLATPSEAHQLGLLAHHIHLCSQARMSDQSHLAPSAQTVGPRN